MRKKTREKMMVAITIFIILIFLIGFIPTVGLF